MGMIPHTQIVRGATMKIFELLILFQVGSVRSVMVTVLCLWEPCMLTVPLLSYHNYKKILHKCWLHWREILKWHLPFYPPTVWWASGSGRSQDQHRKIEEFQLQKKVEGKVSIIYFYVHGITQLSNVFWGRWGRGPNQASDELQIEKCFCSKI